MLKVSIKDNDGSRDFFCNGIEFHNYEEDKAYTRLVLFTPSAKVHSNMFLLEPGDYVFIEEVK